MLIHYFKNISQGSVDKCIDTSAWSRFLCKTL